MEFQCPFLGILVQYFMTRAIWILSILLSSSLNRTSSDGTSHPAYKLGLGEYQCFIINTATGKLYGISNNLTTAGVGWDAGIAGLPMLVGGRKDLSFTYVASGMHNSLAVDVHGDVWTW